MEKHPIENIMSSTMDSIRDMVDVNTVIGEAVVTQDGSTIIPVSRVSFGFVAGGGEYRCQSRPTGDVPGRMPFAGGTGAGVTIEPMGFLVSNESAVRLLPAQPYAPADRIIELAPQLMSELCRFLKSKNDKKHAPQPAASAPLPPVEG